MTLRELKIGESAVVTAVGGEGALRQELLRQKAQKMLYLI